MAKRHTLNKISKVNRARSAEWHGRNPDEEWSITDWSNALCGEIGEACNEIKKIRRIECGFKKGKIKTHKKALAKEIADAFLYLDLLASYYDIDLEQAIVDKFNEVSDREGFEYKL